MSTTAPAPAHSGRSTEATRAFHDLMALPPAVRRDVIQHLDQRDRAHILRAADHEAGTPFAPWADDPIGFVTQVLQESLWSKPRAILTAVPKHQRVAVPSSFGSSKTWTIARLSLWWVMTNPVGTAKVVTIAPIWRQVTRYVWPEIRQAHARARLPGEVDQAQMKMSTRDGLDVVVAYGLSAPPHNETAVQGIHAPRLLVVVDEAGGISHTIGRNFRALLTGGARLVAIGNPPTDDPGSWFEGFCNDDRTHTEPIPASSTPRLSGEKAPRCRTCPPEVPPHPLSDHLVDREWVEDTVAEYGADSNYVQAKVHARFPKGGSNLTIPSGWLDLAAEQDEPEPGPDLVRVTDLGLTGEEDPWLVERGAWVRLGADVAADGGDEFAIARSIGTLTTLRHHSAGQANADHMDVAGVLLREIQQAEVLAKAIDSPFPVHAKIDVIGLGWGVVGTLRAWGAEGMHGATIVPVDVREKPNRDDTASVMRPALKRDEMWLAGRSLAKPDKGTGEPLWRLRLDRHTLAQLATPTYGTNAAGKVVVESKDSMKGRGARSPDRAEAVLLSVYDPGPEQSKRKKARLIV